MIIANQLPKKVKIVEVGPRDGLQNENVNLSTQDKLRFIELLSQTGLETIEVTSFVSPRAIAQMADSSELFSLVAKAIDSKISLPCLVPNEQGMRNALALGVKEIALFSATSDAFTRKNINCSVEGSFERMEAVAKMAHDNAVKMRGYISTAFGCPYAGDMSYEKLSEVVKRFFELGVYEVSIGDTIGVATPKQVDLYCEKLALEFDVNRLAMHFHDTRGMALSNILISLMHGFAIFDSSAAGLGGCPYAKGASGNVATEDVIYLLDGLGIEHGIDLKKMTVASEFILSKLNKVSTSKFLNAYLAAKSAT